MTVRERFTGRAFIPLYPGLEAEEALAVLGAHLSSSPPGPVVCLKPPVAGLAFITTVGEVSRTLDVWWEANVPPGALPVLMMRHEPGLEDWVPVLDAEVVVGVGREEDLGLYARASNARALVTSDARAITAHAMRCHPEWFEQGEEVPVEPAGAPPDLHPASVRLGVLAAGGHREAARSGRSPDLPSEISGPWTGAAFGDRPATDVHDGRDREGWRGSPRSPGGSDHGAPAAWPAISRELAELALAHHTGRIVGVTSPAGGIGTTTVATALGLVYGEAVQESGWYVALLEQTGEAGRWRRLGLSGPARTVSEIMADAESGRRWPIVTWPRSPALVLYPERPGAESGHTRARIERLASRLRQLHCLSVVDLPDRIPAFTSGEAALYAAWTSVSDLLLLLASDDREDLEGILDCLEAPPVAGDERAGVPSVPVIVVRLGSSPDGPEEPAARATLDVIRQRVAAVVDIPQDEPSPAVAGGLAAVEPELRRAYVELALAVARTLLEG
ncbi:MAG TPA: hypothetical protein VFD01_14440 [Candidatus Dormibacteraeota bacterium]|nr:hypothetical protein [Candidatus Dormibacteraeota bacterium]